MSRHADMVRATVASANNASAITASWRRCLDVYRLDPDRADPPRVDLAALELSRTRDADLVDVARPCLDQLFALLTGTDCAILLADRNSVLIDVRTNRATDTFGRRPREWLGTCYSEAEAGTCTMGTCIVEQRGMIIRGPQHFLTRFTNRVGISAPLFGPDGGLIGCLAINQSTQAHEARLDSFLSISLANFARRIETELFARAYPATRLVLASPERRLDALLAVDADGRVIGATRGARRLLELGNGAIARAPNMNGIFPRVAPGDSDSLVDVERRAILRALAQHGDNHTAAAKAIGISRSTLYRKLKSYAVEPCPVEPCSVEPCPVEPGSQAQTSVLGRKSSSALMRLDSASRTSR